VRILFTLMIGLALINIGGQLAAQSIRPLPPVLALDGQALPAPTSSSNNGGGVDPGDILFSEDWENQTVGVQTSSFTNWSRVGQDAGTSCSITEVVASGGPKGGKAFRAYLEDTGTCGRAEIRLNDGIADELVATYVGSAPVPTLANVEFTDHFFYQYSQPATCTSNCQPQNFGFMYSVKIVALPEDGTGGVMWQWHTAGAESLGPNPPYTESFNPVFGMIIDSSRIAMFVRSNASLGNEGTTPTVVTPATFGLSEWTGAELEIFVIERFDTRTDAEGGDGRYEIYINLEGSPSDTPKWTWNGQTMHPGKARYELDGTGPKISNPSTGVYHDPWANNGISTGETFELVFDNQMLINNPVLDEMQVEMAKANFQ
jgi:hypothetical protein